MSGRSGIDSGDHASLSELLRKVAAAEILPRFRALGEGEIAAKSAPADLVTEADLRAEEALTDALRIRWPDALIVGEEAAETDASLVPAIPNAARAVVLDPVDGTWNFAAGLACFATMLAVVERGETVLGLIHDPVLGDTAVADRSGARIVDARGERPLRCSSETDPARMAGFLPLHLAPRAARAPLALAMAGFARVTSLHCSAWEYRLLAAGRVEFVLSTHLKPWDHLAGALLVRQAGGVVRTLAGEDYRAGVTRGPLLAAASEDAWQVVAARLGPAFAA